MRYVWKMLWIRKLTRWYNVVKRIGVVEVEGPWWCVVVEFVSCTLGAVLSNLATIAVWRFSPRLFATAIVKSTAEISKILSNLLRVAVLTSKDIRLASTYEQMVYIALFLQFANFSLHHIHKLTLLARLHHFALFARDDASEARLAIQACRNGLT